MCGSGSRKLLNTDPMRIWIWIHNTVHRYMNYVGTVCRLDFFAVETRTPLCPKARHMYTRTDAPAPAETGSFF